MAIKKKNGEEETPIVVEVETPVEIENDGIEISEPKEVTIPDERVRVNPNTTYNTCIGGEWYYFREGVQVTVPLNVKRIMQEGNMLSPL